MKRRAFTLVEIMIVVAIIALLAAVAIPGLLRARVTANESAAQANLKSISTAMETYSGANNGNYPTGEASLTTAVPPYLAKSYNGQTYSGYYYTYSSMNSGNYTLTAQPAGSCTSGSGTKGFQITTGGVLTEITCAAH